MESQKFNLCWNEFDKAASQTLKNLISDQEFTDVTLTCDDDNQMQAHKIVLSSCSPVFRRMLLKNPHPHPLIHLRGVSHAELKSVIEFIYLGQTEVGQNQLPYFMSVARDLEIRGLSEDLPSVRQADVENIEHFNVEDIADQSDQIVSQDKQEQVQNVSYDMQDVNNILVSEKIEEKYYCDAEKCDFKTKSASHLKLHKKSVHEGIKHQCDQCERSYNFPGDLRRHKKTTHMGLRYPCSYCDFTASQTQTLKNHINKHHSFANIIVTE